MIPSRTAADADGRVDFERARASIVELTEPLGSESVPLAAAYARVAAATAVAAEDLIPYARSAMDGYAVRAADTAAATDARVVLPIASAVYAGDRPRRLAPGRAAPIATGAPLPPGADAVVPIEETTRAADAIVLRTAVSAGRHVFAPGDDARRGDVLVGPGDELSPGRIGLLAAAGHAYVRVYRRPRVALVCTGDELVPVAGSPGIGQVRNSNAEMLAALLARDGADVVACAQAADAPAPLAAALRTALATSDLVITTGGASVGERDLVKGVLRSLGTRFAFGSVALRPAKPAAFGRCGSSLAAVLPGNPAAASIGYSTLVRGAIRRLGGRSDAYPAAIGASLAGDIRTKSDRHFVVFARLTWARGTFTAEPLANQCSSLVRTSADSNALIIVPPGSTVVGRGAIVGVEVLDWSAVTFAT